MMRRRRNGYLRDLTQTASPDDANIVVKIDPPENGALAGNPDVPQFGFEEWWTPDFRSLTITSALKIFSRNAPGATSKSATWKSGLETQQGT